VLVGNSLGGRVSLEAGLAHPKSVARGRAAHPVAGLPGPAAVDPPRPLVSPELARVPLPMSHRLVVEGIRSMFSVPGRLPETWYDAAADEAVRVLLARPPGGLLLDRAADLPRGRLRPARLLAAACPAAAARAVRLGRPRPAGPSSFARTSRRLPERGQVVMEDCGHVPQFEHPSRPWRCCAGSSSTSEGSAEPVQTFLPYPTCAPAASCSTTGAWASSGWRPSRSCGR
jgi:pimeloyl-ACP methyl ester carboxylesterase